MCWNGMIGMFLAEKKETRIPKTKSNSGAWSGAKKYSRRNITYLWSGDQ